MAVVERYSALDVIRGVALFGVLLVNLVVGFRVCIFEYYFTFHTHPGIANMVADYVREIFISGKAMALFTLLFGVGVAVQYDRARARGRRPVWFLLRRLLVLLCFGVLHYLLLWDGDVLMLYAMCGFALLLFVKASPKVLVSFGILLLLALPVLFGMTSSGAMDKEMWREPIEAFAEWYAHPVYAALVGFRFLMVPYFLSIAIFLQFVPTAGLMLLGMAAWRSGVVQHPGTRNRLLWGMVIGGGGVGICATLVDVLAQAAQLDLGRYIWICSILAQVPLALAYGSAMLLYLQRHPVGAWRVYFAAAGRMAVTNYLTQSLIFSFLFYGYGFGLFGKLNTVTATLLGILVYLCQLRLSHYWLQHHRFGPVEWLWRRLTYGKQAV
ncbi:uncharacterized protein DES53_102547 [Roseimicrobium gellanilyticum]|uniref:DUF418 domain-containing protein n=1 Tax=Roseimicrobium gellanilyticum TaxID=748857 RepID=A0A366HR68_9BACT|nr:uncharacterized protein DES53_102547 [Roseimicrobium gellanilyticum]